MSVMEEERMSIVNAGKYGERKVGGGMPVMMVVVVVFVVIAFSL